MEELLRLKDECRADILNIRVEDGIVRILAIRSNIGKSLSKSISEEAVRHSTVPPYELVKRLMNDFTAD